MELITNVLYWLSTGLMIPVTIFLIFYFVKSVLMIGGFYGAYITRTKTNTKINKDIETMPTADILANLANYSKSKSDLLNTLNRISNAKGNAAMINKIVGDYEIIADKEVGKSKLLVKIGPMLGLMGTLIPMGPALVGLATGDISSMASNMQVAFSTTVIGIIIGAIGFITLQVKQRWVADDMNLLDYIVDSLNQK